MVEFPTFMGSWPWPWIRVKVIPLCISHHICHRNRRNLFVDGRAYGHTNGRKFDTHIIRSTSKVWKSTQKCKMKSLDFVNEHNHHFKKSIKEWNYKSTSEKVSQPTEQHGRQVQTGEFAVKVSPACHQVASMPDQEPDLQLVLANLL